MIKIFVYNNNTNKIETYLKNLNDAMPYNTNRTLTISEFRGASKSNILWTDLRTMQAWNSFRYLYGKPIYVGFAFKRPWEGGHSILSQHYAGVAFDAGQNLDLNGRQNLRTQAYNSEIWAYVEPLSLTPRWVHFDNRWVQSGYPLTKQGNKGNYVFIAQDGLTTLGYDTGGFDGIFGSKTRNSVINYQTQNGLSPDGIIGPKTWNSLMSEIVGKGSTNTTIN